MLLKEAQARHIIVFLSDAKLIHKTFRDMFWLQNKEKGGLSNKPKLSKLKYRLFEAHGGTNFKENKEIFEEIAPNEVKLILASKVLETSITIESVGFIVDFGLEKIYKFNSNNGVSSSICRAISKTTAEQRTGRTGRTARGICYRMYNAYDLDDQFYDSNDAVSYKEGNLDILCMNFLKMMEEKDHINWVFESNKDHSLKNSFCNYEKSSVDINDPKEVERRDLNKIVSKITSLEMINTPSNDDLKDSLRHLQKLKLIKEDYQTFTNLGKKV